MQSEERKIYVLRLDHRLEQSLAENIVGLGWWRANNLLQIEEWEAFKEHIKTSHPGDYQNVFRLGNVAGSLWCFLKSISKGDRIIIPIERAFHVATVESDAFYDDTGANDNQDYAYRRQVTWLTEKEKPIPRDHAIGRLQRWMKARQTCVEVDNNLLQEIDDAIERKSPVDFSEIVLKSAYDHVARALHDAVNDKGLEEIVRRLSNASGANSWIPPKNIRLPGDADVIAEYNLGIADSDAIIEVAYQVKQHKGKSDEAGIRQLLDRMESSPTIIRGCFVTTAKDVSDEAKELAKNNDIIILTENELVHWVLSVGLGAQSLSK